MAVVAVDGADWAAGGVRRRSFSRRGLPGWRASGPSGAEPASKSPVGWGTFAGKCSAARRSAAATSRASSSLTSSSSKGRVGQGDGRPDRASLNQADDGGGLRGGYAIDEFVGLLLRVHYGLSHGKSFLSKVTVRLIVPTSSGVLPAGGSFGLTEAAFMIGFLVVSIWAI